jgi:hypothetical protein
MFLLGLQRALHTGRKTGPVKTAIHLRGSPLDGVEIVKARTIAAVAQSQAYVKANILFPVDWGRKPLALQECAFVILLFIPADHRRSRASHLLDKWIIISESGPRPGRDIAELNKFPIYRIHSSDV